MKYPLSILLAVATVSTAWGEEPATTDHPDSIALPDYTDLDELVVVQKKKMVESDGAKLSYNVSDDPEASSSSIMEILRKVPGVTVDAEDNVKVNGQSSFKILMNGKEDPMLKGDLKTVLKSIPAASILKIEVISEPGAKYDAEGVGGILNIVTDKKTKLEGYSAQFGGWLRATQMGGYLNGRTKLGNVMLDANVSYNNGRVFSRKWYNDSERESLDGSENHLLLSNQEQASEWDYTGVTLNMSWEPNTNNLFTFQGNYGYNSWSPHGSMTRAMYNPAGDVLWKTEQVFRNGGEYNGFSLSGSYQHNFKRDDNNLVISYLFTDSPVKSLDEYDTTEREGLIDITPYSAMKSKTLYLSHIIQIDYLNQLSEKHLFEAGAKGSINRSNNVSSTLEGDDRLSAVTLSDTEVDAAQTKDIYSLYSSYTGKFGSWSIKGGLRYEMTRMGMHYKVGEYEDFMTTLHDLVPNAAVSYNISDASAFRLAYQMRISRPDISQVNPYRNTLNLGTVTYGNPNLESQKMHTFSFGYTNYEGKLTGGAKLTYRYLANGITDIIFMKEGLMNTTYANSGVEHAAMLDLNANWNITSDLQWGVNASGSYSHFSSDSELLKARKAGWQVYASTNLNYNMPWKVRMSVNGGVYTPWSDIQSRGTHTNYYYSLGFSRSFLPKDALTVQLSASNFLTPNQNYGWRQESESMRVLSRSRSSQWNVGVSVTFKIGGLKAQVKKTAAELEKEENGGGSQKNG